MSLSCDVLSGHKIKSALLHKGFNLLMNWIHFVELQSHFLPGVIIGA